MCIQVLTEARYSNIVCLYTALQLTKADPGKMLPSHNIYAIIVSV